MLLLLVIILFGILVSVFATQNNDLTTISLANLTLSGIPVYYVALGGLLAGVLLSWILSFFGTISSFFALRGKDSAIDHLNRTTADLKKKIRDLEVENARLKGEQTSGRPHFNLMRKPHLAE